MKSLPIPWPTSRSYRVSLTSNLLTYSIVLSALTLACSDVVVAPQGGAEAGQITAGTQPPAGSSTSGVIAGGTQPIPDECYLGEDLGICISCSPSREPIQLPRDDRCPYIPCETLTQYQVMELEGGGQSCVQFIYEPPVDNCKGIGVCYEDPEEACTLNPSPVPLFNAYPGCGEFSGCEGSVSPDASLKGEGETCHSVGTCDSEGRCSAPASCEGSKPDFALKHCPDPNESDPEGCDLLIDITGESGVDDISCSLACATQNGCLAAWESDNECERGSTLSCNDRERRLICRCRGRG